DPQRGLWQKREGASGGARNHCAIDGTDFGRTAPDHVSILRVRGGDAPEVIAVVRKLFAKLDAEAAMNFRRNDRVLKVICIAIPLTAKVKPCLGVLMDEERGV